MAGMSLPTTRMGPGGKQAEKALHTRSEIALALRHKGDPLPQRAKARCEIAVRIDREHGAPARVRRQAQQGVREAAAIGSGRGDAADRARQPAFHAAQIRALGHDDEALGVADATLASGVA